MRLRFALAAVLLAACGTSHRDDTPARTKPVAPPAVVEKAAPPPPEFPTTTRSLRLNKTVAVRLEPGEDAKRVGTIAVDTRVGWNKTEKAPGCGRTWVQIQPYGWVCGDALDPSDERPRGREIPDLDRDEIVPGVYGKITEAGALTFSLDEPGAKPPKKKKDPRPGKPGKDAKKPAEPPPPPSGDEPGAHPDDPDAAAAEPVVVCDPKGPKMVPGAPIVGSANVRQYGKIGRAHV